MPDQKVVNATDDRYCDLLRRILGTGMDMPDRTGTGRRSLFGPQLCFHNVAEELPILTTKRIWFKAVKEELLWFLRGETNIKSLQATGVTIWDEWAKENGDVGPVYGYQWRSWWDHDQEDKVDQLAQVIEQIKTNPWSRRLVVSAWNVPDVPRMGLPACHMFFQFQVTPAVANPQEVRGGTPKPALLNCHMYMRSADVFLGVPFNITSYALLLCMVAQVTKLKPDNLTISFGDVHIYHNHFEQVEEQLGRWPTFVAPKLILAEHTDIDAFTSKDILLENYLSHPPIKGQVSV